MGCIAPTYNSADGSKTWLHPNIHWDPLP
jgi:hypothetical protein